MMMSLILFDIPPFSAGTSSPVQISLEKNPVRTTSVANQNAGSQNQWQEEVNLRAWLVSLLRRVDVSLRGGPSPPMSAFGLSALTMRLREIFHEVKAFHYSLGQPFALRIDSPEAIDPHSMTLVETLSQPNPILMWAAYVQPDNRN